MPNPPQPQQDGIADDFFEQIFSMPGYSSGDPGLSAGDGSGSGGFAGFPLELRSEQGRPGYAATEEVSSGSMSGVGKRLREAAEGRASSDVILHGQSMQLPIAPIPQLSAPRPRVRARRGQATDPHSIAERLRRERIAERMRALQELVPNTNKNSGLQSGEEDEGTDRAAMLDEIVDYVKFLRLQVKFLSMSRLGGAGAGAQLVADIPISQAEGDSGSDARNKQQVWEKWSNDGTERHVLKLMEEDVGAAMQFLQSKALCMMPIPLASAFYRTQSHLENPSAKPEPNTPPS